MQGVTDEAAAALDILEKQRHPSWRHVGYEHSIAKAWVNATRGAISEAKKIAMSAAETASTNGQFAAEVMCLRTAVQFGERSCAPRLRELAAIVEGPRAGVAARFAAGLEGDDGPELAALSEEFERMGDLVAAVYAAAHAALAYRAPGTARIGVGLLGASRSARRTVWCQYARAASSPRAVAAERSRTRDCHAGG